MRFLPRFSQRLIVEGGSDFWIVCHNSSFCFTLLRSASARDPLSTKEAKRSEPRKTVTASCPASDRSTGLRFDWGGEMQQQACEGSDHGQGHLHLNRMMYDIVMFTYLYS